MSFYGRILLRKLCGAASINRPRAAFEYAEPHLHLFFSDRGFKFRSEKKAAGVFTCCKRRNRSPFLFPDIPGSTSASAHPIFSPAGFHKRILSLIRYGELDDASSEVRFAYDNSYPIRSNKYVTYNAVMAAMVRAGRLDNAFYLFRHAQLLYEKHPNVESLIILINTHCDAGRVDKGLYIYRKLFAAAASAPPVSIPEVYRFLTKGLLHVTKGLIDADHIQEAVDLLRDMLHRGHGADSLVYNNLIGGFIARGDWTRALELFDELRERCPVYDGVVHATIMEGYWKEGKDKEAMESYQSLLDRQFQMNPATCNVLLETLLKHDKTEEAERLFEHMLGIHKPPKLTGINTETYNVMVNDRIRRGKFEEAVEVFHRTGKKPCVMDVERFNNIIGKFVEHGLISEAEKLFEKMTGESVGPDTTTYGYFVDYYFKEGKVDDVMRYFDKAEADADSYPRISARLYNKMFDGLMKAGSASKALDIFRRMRERTVHSYYSFLSSKVHPKVSSYEILINGLCKEDNLDQARDLMEEMIRSNFYVPRQLRGDMMDTFSKAGRAVEMRRLIRLYEATDQRHMM